MANWSNPTLTSLYTDFVTEVKDRDLDVAKGMDPAIVTVTNPVANMIRWNSANRLWEIYSGVSWGAAIDYYAIQVGAFTGDVTKPAGSSALTIAAAHKFVGGNVVRMMFQMTSAPTGWTKDTSATYNDAAPRFTTGTVGAGGTVVFSTAFVSGAVTGSGGTGATGATAPGNTDAASPGSTDGFTLTTAEMPAHTHQETASDGGGGSISIQANASTVGNTRTDIVISTQSTGGGNSHVHSHSATHIHAHSATHTHTGPSHTHSMASANLKYVDMICASKD